MPADKPTELSRIKLKTWTQYSVECRIWSWSELKSETSNNQQTEYPLTNRLSYRGSSKNLNSTALAIYMSVDALAQASDLRIERRQVVLLGWMQDSELGSLRHQIARQLNAHSQTVWAIEDQALFNQITYPLWVPSWKPWQDWTYRH